jgi:hypothetical protein
MDSSQGLRVSTHRYLALTEPLFFIFVVLKWDSSQPLFGILVVWKWDYSRVMRTLAEEYITYGDQLFIILADWKCDCCRVLKSFIPGLLASCQALLGILASWKFNSFNGHESLESNVSSFRCVNVWHFDGLKIRFHKFPEILGWMSRGSRGRSFYILVAWKCDSWRVARPSAQV